MSTNTFQNVLIKNGFNGASLRSVQISLKYRDHQYTRMVECIKWDFMGTCHEYEVIHIFIKNYRLLRKCI